MKKLMAGILAVVLVLTAGAAGVSAAGRGYGAGHHGAGQRAALTQGAHACCRVDGNGDGVCDVCGRAPGSCGWLDENGDGVCDLCGRVPRQGGANGGRYWVDENNDGVCDNRGICCGAGRWMRTVSVN